MEKTVTIFDEILIRMSQFLIRIACEKIVERLRKKKNQALILQHFHLLQAYIKTGRSKPLIAP